MDNIVETNENKKDFKYYRKKLGAYLIKTLNGMAYGLFSTLIIGTILKTLGDLTGFGFLIELSVLVKTLTGVGIGVGVAWSLNLTGLKLVAAAVAGGIASTLEIGRPGDPMVEYLAVVISVELLSLILRKKTPVDIIIIPLLSCLIAYGVWYFTHSPIQTVMTWIGEFIQSITFAQPFIMGIFIAVIMGMILTAPISSAAIAILISLGGIAGGAAVVGCSVQMLGFAVMSRKDNNIGTVISVGIGTSMLQFKNILKKPIIWLPTIIVSAILGPLATLVFKTMTTPAGAGMGTSGLVGQIETFNAMREIGASPWLSIIILQIVLPIILVYIVDIIFRKKGWIKEGDLKI